MADFKEIQIGEDGQVYQVKDETARNSQGGYEPPTGGIPKTDLASDVQTSLGKADTALQQADKTQLQNAINSLQSALDTLIGSGNVQGAIDTFNEVKAFLNGIDTDDPTLANQLLALNNAITALQTTLSQKANDNSVVKSISVNGTAQTKDGNGNVNVSVPTLTLDDVPTAGSDNAVKSGGIKTAIDNVSPRVSENGNWIIDGVETEHAAQGPRGNSVVVNEGAAEIKSLIVNNVVDGGETEMLSAEMGKVLRINLMALYNALGVYAFPDGKPTLNWRSTQIKHKVYTTGLAANLTLSDIEIDGVSQQSLPNEAEVLDGKSLTFKINPPSNLYVIDDDNMSLTMGGVSIKATAFDASTGIVAIAAVTGDIAISASALTYIGVDGFSLGSTADNTLKSLFDGKNVDSANNQWVDMMDNTRILELTNCDIQSDHVAFDGSTSEAMASSTSTGIDILYDAGTAETIASSICDSSHQYFHVMDNHRLEENGTFKSAIIITGIYNSSKGAVCVDNYQINTDLPSNQQFVGFPNSWVTGKSGLVATEIYHLSISYDRAFFNGVALSRSASSSDKTAIGAIANSKLALMCRQGNSSVMHRQGKAYCIRVYDRKLSQTEVLHNYKIDKKRFNLA